MLLRHKPQATRNTYLALLVGLIFFAIYALTAAPSILTLFDDSLEFQLVLPTFGIAHPTGYPLYVLIGGLWSRLLPFGSWAWRVNLFSAIAGAIAVTLVFAMTKRIVARARPPLAIWAGIAAAITFGLGPVWWEQTTVAEVYALHNLLVAAVLYVAVDLESRTSPGLERRIALLFFLVGLGLAHHRTIVLLAPGLAVYLLWAIPGIWRPRRVWLWWGLALLAPLLLYLFLPLRSFMGAGDLHGSYANTWTGFWDHVLARGYTSFFSSNALSIDRSPSDWLALWITQCGWLGMMLAAVGLLWLTDRQTRKAVVLITVVLATNVVFTLFYRVGDQQVFLLPALLCAAVLTGAGLAWLAQWTPGKWASWAALAGALLLLLGLGRGPWVNRSRAWSVHDYAIDVAKTSFAPGSVVIGLEGEVTALRYMQQSAGLGVAAEGKTADDPEQRRQAIAAAIEAGRPVYLTRELEGIADRYSFSGEGPLVRVWPRGETSPQTPQVTLNQSMANGAVDLLGYDMELLNWAQGLAVRPTFYWLPTTQLTQTFKVSLRIIGPDGAPLSGADGAPAVTDRLPLRQVAPSTTWAPGVPVRDVYELYLPPDALKTPARLQAILYDGDTLAEAGRIELPVPTPPN